MSIVITDPLIFLTSQGGVVGTPLLEAGAGGAENLDVPQRGAVIGEPIPLVFCRRVDGVGGVLISPAATEARFEDDAESDITASYHLVLSEGEIDSIQVRDVFQRACRVGSFSQTYNKRAGTFIPGNFIDNTPGLEAPAYCGTGGRYTGLSTMAFSVTIPAGFDQWNRQVHCFVRGGFRIQRLLDSVTGPSNNVADLLLHLFRVSSRVPEDQIDTASLLSAATFTNANGFWFNGELKLSTNLRDWASSTLQYFMLRQSRINGKEALRPLLPANADGTINIGPIEWVFTFTERHVIPDTFEVIYSPLADRKPFCVTVLWRQQDDLGIPVMRTAEVRYVGTAEDGPFEQHDLTAFCASENHAVKAGSYILSKRNHVTHRVQVSVRPDSYNRTLASGDIVRLRLVRRPAGSLPSVHDYLYEVDRIGKSIAGEIKLQLIHFPVDDTLSSVVAKEVAAATGSGQLLPTGLTGVTCDINDFDDLTIPFDDSLDPSAWDLPPIDLFEIDIPEIPEFGEIELGIIEGLGGIGNINIGGSEQFGEIGSFGSVGGFDGFGDLDADLDVGSGLDLDLGLDPELGNPVDPLEAEPSAPPVTGGSGENGNARAGDTLGYEGSLICAGFYTEWFLVDTVTGTSEMVSSGEASTYIVATTAATSGKEILAVGRCPDDSSPDGYGPPITSAPIKVERAVKPGFENTTFSGTYSPTGTTILVLAGSWTGTSNFGECGDYTSAPYNSTFTLAGVTGTSVAFSGGSATCGGRFSAVLNITNGAGSTSGLVNIDGSGSDIGISDFSGGLSFSTTAPDALPASELRFAQP